MSIADRHDMAKDIAADLARIQAELIELADDAVAARLVRAKLRIDRMIEGNGTTINGLLQQAGKMKRLAAEETGT